LEGCTTDCALPASKRLASGADLTVDPASGRRLFEVDAAF